MKITLDSPVRDIDPKIATRRVGMKDKGPPAYVVLEDSMGISTVRRLLHHYPRTHIDRTHIAEIRDPLPEEVTRPEGLVSFDWAIRKIHFPDSPQELDRARERLKFDELFTLELGVAFRKHRVARAESGVAHERDGVLLKRLL